MTQRLKCPRRVKWLVGVVTVWMALGQQGLPCTSLLVGKQATADGSVLLASSCDGDIMGVLYVMPAREYPAGTELPMYWNVPRPKTYAQYVENVRKGYQHVGKLPVRRTYRTILTGGNVESMTTGGVNEFGLTIAIEFIPMRKGLACARGVVGPNSNHWTTSLIANGLMRAKTAREAIRVIGAMVEKYGFLYYRAPQAGVALPIADGQEVWLMEIFGPGASWTPDSGEPGGVWCAQRIPDGEVGCSANRSRIGAIDLDDPDHFMASPNVHALAEQLGFYRAGSQFVWREVYGTPGSRANCLREWRALSLIAPSHGLTASGDPERDVYPFSVRPDHPVDVPKLMSVMRDAYEGTRFDVTEQAAFQVEGKKSPLARPTGPSELFDLLGIRQERAICTPTSGYVFVAQLRDWLPHDIGACLWFAYGPACTSCFVPIYAGVTELPRTWCQPADFTRIDRAQPQWNFRLVSSLANQLRYQDIVADIRKVIEPAERQLFAQQEAFERSVLELLEKQERDAARQRITHYSGDCARQVGAAYSRLVDYLLFQYLLDNPEVAPPAVPRIVLPRRPTANER